MNRHGLDFAAWSFAGVAGIALSQAAYAVTIIAGLVSAILGLIKLHDRFRYGPFPKNRNGVQ